MHGPGVPSSYKNIVLDIPSGPSLLLLLLQLLGLELGHLGHLRGIGNGIIRLGKAEEMILIVELEGIVGLGCRVDRMGWDGMRGIGTLECISISRYDKAKHTLVGGRSSSQIHHRGTAGK